MADLRDVVRRQADLASRPNAIRGLRSERQRAVVDRRWYAGGNTLHRPEPLLAQRLGRAPGRWIEGEPSALAVECGIDASGRVVIAHGILGSRAYEHLLTPCASRDEIVILRREGRLPQISVIHVDYNSVGSVSETCNSDGEIEQYRYDPQGRLIEIEQRGNSPSIALYRCEYVDDQLFQISESRGDRSRVSWNADEDGIEAVLPPLSEIADGLAPGLAQAIAVGIAAQAASLPAPRCAMLHIPGKPFGSKAFVLDDSYLVSPIWRRSPDSVLDDALVAAGHSDGVVRFDPLAYANADVRRRIRQFRQWTAAHTNHHEVAAASDTEVSVSFQALQLLNGRVGIAPVPVVLWGDLIDHAAWPQGSVQPRWPSMRRQDSLRVRRWAPTIATAGGEAVEALWSVLDKRRPAMPSQSISDRAALRAAACDLGLHHVAERLVELAEVGYALQPSDGRPSGCWLGGGPPPGAHHTLIHLATLACEELHREAGSGLPLPDTGSLSFFADPNTARSSSGVAHVVYVRDPAQADFPSSTGRSPTGFELRRVAVRPQAVLTLPIGHDTRDHLGLSHQEWHAYLRLVTMLPGNETAARVLGHPRAVQDRPIPASHLLLFEIRSTSNIGIDLLDAGALYFHTDKRTLSAQDWSAVQVAVDLA